MVQDFIEYWRAWLIKPYQTSYELIGEEGDHIRFPLASTALLVGTLCVFLSVISNLLMHDMWITSFHAVQILIFVLTLFGLDVLFAHSYNLISGGNLYLREVISLSALSMLTFVAFLLLIPIDLLGPSPTMKLVASVIIIIVHWVYLLVSVSGANETGLLRSFIGWMLTVSVFFLSIFASALVYTLMTT